MRAMVCEATGPVEGRPLALRELPEPEPAQGEVPVDVEVCGVCRTDLHVIEGELDPRKSTVVPGHQAIGVRRDDGRRVGVPWLHSACGACLHCGRSRENLCERPVFTGYDRDGGFAEVVLADPRFTYEIPDALPSEHAAPLLCAGIIGYRAFVRSNAKAGSRLGLYGFGASAHIVMQIARHFGCEVYVATRGRRHRELAEEMGAKWVGTGAESPPSPLDSAIVFAPAGELVPVALEALDRGGTVACAGIHMTAVPQLEYSRHLFHEKTLTTVTSNTRKDGEGLFRLAAAIPIRTEVETFGLDEANDALAKLKNDEIRGAAVLRIAG